MHIQSCYPTLNPSQLLQNEAFHRYRLTLEIIIKELMCSALNLSLKRVWLNNTKTSEPSAKQCAPLIIISQEEANKCGLDMIGSFPKPKKKMSAKRASRSVPIILQFFYLIGDPYSMFNNTLHFLVGISCRRNDPRKHVL
ncbi:hypothetical protein CEXT_424091 [Caerostris extrusa]|uniref:Uncharacterized protein n=1 Tax=Caerostris extrusa TaxID=172846 RepID=A0AAV4M8G1_CAEEX|nr:hypothetical protein CEXT_424091 [Caerostris extrusa]